MIDGPGRVSTAPMGAYVALQAGVKPHTLRHQALTATATASTRPDGVFSTCMFKSIPCAAMIASFCSGWCIS